MFDEIREFRFPSVPEEENIDILAIKDWFRKKKSN